MRDVVFYKIFNTNIQKPCAMDSVLRGKLAEQMSRAENEALLAGMENTYQLLRQSGLMYTIQISPAFVGCHPQNRDGIGVDQQHVHSLVDKFQESGFVSSAGRYMAVEVEPVNNTVKDFNEEMVAKSNGQLLDCIAGTYIDMCQRCGWSGLFM